MFKMATLPEHQTPPNNLVHCANCGRPMAAIGANYVCLVNAEQGPDRCPTTPVNADKLVIQVITQVLKRIINDTTIESLTADVQQAVSEKSSTQQEQLQCSESSIEELYLLKEQVLHRVEEESATYGEVAEVVSQINTTRIGSGLPVSDSTGRAR